MPQHNYIVREEDFTTLSLLNDAEENQFQWPSIFMLPFWLQTWWRHFGDGLEMLILSFRESGQLCGIAPLLRSGASARLLGSPDVCDYLDLVAVPGREIVLFEALLEALPAYGINRLELTAQRPEALVFGSFFASSRSANWLGCLERENEAAEIVLPGSWEAYLGLLDKKQRHEVRRKIRKLENETELHRYRCLDNPGDIAAFMPAFFELFLQNPDKDRFMTTRMNKFFRNLISAGTAAGLVRFGLLEVEQKVVAAVLYFDYQGKINLYNSGYDSDYAALSVGLLSKLFCIRDSIEKGKKSFDFLKGQESYKSRLGGKIVPIYKVVITKT